MQKRRPSFEIQRPFSSNTTSLSHLALCLLLGSAAQIIQKLQKLDEKYGLVDAYIRFRDNLI